MRVAGVVKDWLLISLSAIWFKSPLSVLNVVGYAIAFSGVIMYNFFKQQVGTEKRPQEEVERGWADRISCATASLFTIILLLLLLLLHHLLGFPSTQDRCNSLTVSNLLAVSLSLSLSLSLSPPSKRAQDAKAAALAAASLAQTKPTQQDSRLPLSTSSDMEQGQSKT